MNSVIRVRERFSFSTLSNVTLVSNDVCGVWAAVARGSSRGSRGGGHFGLAKKRACARPQPFVHYYF
jgi:hypothetical protein